MDLISRQDAIDALATYIHHVDRAIGTGKLSDQQCVESAHSIIDEVPSAQRKGEWIRNMDSLIGAIQKPYCSVCGHSAIGNHGFDCIITNFCPNCGARLVRGEEDDSRRTEKDSQ